MIVSNIPITMCTTVPLEGLIFKTIPDAEGLNAIAFPPAKYRPTTHKLLIENE